MHKFTNTLTPTQVSRFAVDFCQPHLQFRAVGKVTAEVPLTIPVRCRRPHLLDRRDVPSAQRRPCEETFTAGAAPGRGCLTGQVTIQALEAWVGITPARKMRKTPARTASVRLQIRRRSYLPG